MRKLLISILLVSALIGASLPASAGILNVFDNDLSVQNAHIGQTQTAIPVSIGNTAIFGAAGNQLVIQKQHASIKQSVHQ